MSLFLVFEVAVGQGGNPYIEENVNGTSWLNLDVLLFYNSVTTTTIGYGANFYPRNTSGQIYLIIFSWFTLANTFYLISAISNFVKQRATHRWEIRQKDLMITTGLGELEGLLDELHSPEYSQYTINEITGSVKDELKSSTLKSMKSMTGMKNVN